MRGVKLVSAVACDECSERNAVKVVLAFARLGLVVETQQALEIAVVVDRVACAMTGVDRAFFPASEGFFAGPVPFLALAIVATSWNALGCFVQAHLRAACCDPTEIPAEPRSTAFGDAAFCVDLRADVAQGAIPGAATVEA